MHRQISVDGLSLEEIYDVRPIERSVETTVVEQDNVFVSCSYCKRQVHASRYTNHLEKCLTGSRRMVTSKQRQEAAREMKRKQLQILDKPQLYGVYDATNEVREGANKLRKL
uniref:SAGA-associated factor 11 n=1 Tax=Hyaloperonospora arabidopsidis (strain Emoy2) TaxID=559515 RepID=M4BZI7_HYAAE